MTARRLVSVVLPALAIVVSAACVDHIAAIGPDGGSSAVGGASGVGVGQAMTVSASSGPTDTECGYFADLDACTVDTSVPDVLDVSSADDAMVGTWRRCNDLEPGVFDVGVRFQANGRVYRLYRRPNDLGTTSANLVYCGTDLSDGGEWLLDGPSATIADAYDVTIDWDNGDSVTFAVVSYASQSGMGLFDPSMPSTPELFAHEGPAL